MPSIALLNKEYTLIAFVDHEVHGFRTEVFDHDHEKEIVSLISTFDHTQLFVSRELFDESGNTYLVDKPVGSGDPEYLEAVSNELKRHYFIAAVIDHSLKEYFLLTRDVFLDPAVRRDLVVMLVHISPEDKAQLEDALTTVKPILDAVRKNRDEWKKTLDQKTGEILKNE